MDLTTIEKRLKNFYYYTAVECMNVSCKEMFLQIIIAKENVDFTIYFLCCKIKYLEVSFNTYEIAIMVWFFELSFMHDAGGLGQFLAFDKTSRPFTKTLLHRFQVLMLYENIFPYRLEIVYVA